MISQGDSEAAPNESGIVVPSSSGGGAVVLRPAPPQAPPVSAPAAGITTPMYTYVQLVEVPGSVQRLPEQQQQQAAFHVPYGTASVAAAPAAPPPAAAMRAEIPLNKWKSELRVHGAATCVHRNCSISFLTMAGIVAHHKNCIGYAKENDYVPCSHCGLRFKQFKSLKSHQDRKHLPGPGPGVAQPIMVKGVQYIPVAAATQPPAEIAAAAAGAVGFTRYEPAKQYGRHAMSSSQPLAAAAPAAAVPKIDASPPSEQRVTYLPKELEDELDAPTTSQHSGAEHAARIMAESRKMSTARPRGRPKKNLSPPRQPPPPPEVDVFDVGTPALRQATLAQTVTQFHHNRPQYQLVPIQALPPPPPPSSPAQVAFDLAPPKVIVPDRDESLVQRRVAPAMLVQLPADPALRPAPMAFMTPPAAASRSRTSSPAAESSSSSSIEQKGAARVMEPQQPTGSGITDLDAKERELADQEAKLRDYEKIVVQSEQLAKKAALMEREKRLKERELELRQRLAQAVQVLEDTKTATPPSPSLDNEGMQSPPPPPPISHSPAVSQQQQQQRIPSMTPPAVEPTSTGQIDESDSAVSNDETSSVITSASRASREPHPNVHLGRSSTSPKQVLQASHRQEDPGDDENGPDTPTSSAEAKESEIVPDALSSSGVSSSSIVAVKDQDQQPVEVSQNDDHLAEEEFVLSSTPCDPPPAADQSITVEEVEEAGNDSAPAKEIPVDGGAAFKVIAMGGAEGEGASVDPESVAHILSDGSLEIANSSDLVEINTDGIMAAVVVEQAIEVVPHTVQNQDEDTSKTPNAPDDINSSPAEDSVPDNAESVEGKLLVDRDSQANSSSETEAAITPPVVPPSELTRSTRSPSPKKTRVVASLPQPSVSSRGRIRKPKLPSQTGIKIIYPSERDPILDAGEGKQKEADVAPSTNPSKRSLRTTSRSAEPAQVPEKRPRGRPKRRATEAETAPRQMSTSSEREQNPPEVKKPRGRARKRRMSQTEPEADGEDEEDIPLKKKKTTAKGRKRRGKAGDKSTAAEPDLQHPDGGVQCGKCIEVFRNAADFLRHAATSHGGIARQEGQSQEFSEEEVEAALKTAFEKASSVPCYKCLVKSFGSRLGLKYHLRTCGLTKDEIQDLKVQCPFEGCKYRGFPDALRSHQTRHYTEVKEEEERHRRLQQKMQEEKEDEEAASTGGGRSRRRAASKAKERVSEAISILKAREGADETADIDRDEDDDDDFVYDANKEVDVDSKFEMCKADDGTKTFHCNVCDFTSTKREELAPHLVAEHADELEGDDYNADDDDDASVDGESGDGYLDDDEDGDYVEVTPRGQRKKSYGGKRSNRPVILDPSPDFIEIEKNFRESNYHLTNLNELLSKDAGFVEIESVDEKSRFMPKQATSINFSSRPVGSENTDETEQLSLSVFSSHMESSSSSYLFAGGPIWASEWCPDSDLQDPNLRYLALSTYERKEKPKPHRGLIQIWSHSSRSGNASFCFGIAHPHGSVRGLKWCPSGARGSHRLGLLAVASSDGRVRVYSVCHPASLSAGGFYTAQPLLCLQVPQDSRAECMKLSWYRGTGHRVIAASFANGLVALWDLNQDEDSLMRDDLYLYPYISFRAHHSSVTAIDLDEKASDQHPEFPAHLATGSDDRHTRIWDLEAVGGVPAVLQSVRRGLVSDVSFVRNYPGYGHLAISFDDVYLQSHTQTVVYEFSDGRTGGKTHPIVAHNSAVWSHSYNPWLSVLAIGTAAGELIAYVSPPFGKAIEYDKENIRRRAFIYRIEEVRDESSGAATAIRFNDSPLSKLSSAPAEELQRARSAEAMSMEDISRPTIVGVNRVSASLDPAALGLIFSGTESGIGRIQDVSSFRTSDVQKAVKKTMNI